MRFNTISKQVTSYYDLVNFKHQMLANQILHRLDGQISAQVVDVEETDNTLNYLYNYMEGLLATNTERYIEALSYYREAEKYLVYVSTNEQAEFYFRQAHVYYRLDQNLTALSYANHSFEMIKNSQRHTKLKINALMLKSGVYSEAGNYDRSDKYSNQAIMLATQEPYAKSLAIRGKANNSYRHGRLDEAINLYSEALDTGGQKNTIIGVKTRYNLANTLLKIGAYDKGKELLERVEKELEDHSLGLREYVARCSVTRGLYLERTVDESLINRGFMILKEHHLFFEMNELAEDLSNYYKLNENYEKALSYLHISQQATKGNYLIGAE
ncbi:hypothetical protein [Geomicrobium sp. JCM 19039]|uniref:hypothetical protein n=1 Tax=Geomicrobium sp. JCM 19039 TaxID=1460636 RepID=UPI00045F2D61|nr:hypothetical protein [Geomicrobium sp. JCM 19039]GAK10426.1 response regulator aspartate phosphatase [Geomicrobium sp. JCM 19039]